MNKIKTILFFAFLGVLLSACNPHSKQTKSMMVYVNNTDYEININTWTHGKQTDYRIDTSGYLSQVYVYGDTAAALIYNSDSLLLRFDANHFLKFSLLDDDTSRYNPYQINNYKVVSTFDDDFNLYYYYYSFTKVMYEASEH